MFNFNSTDFQRVAFAAVGALVLSTTAVTAAVGPAMVPGAAPVSYAQADVAEEARA